jgi:hypothetical protein
MTIDTVSRTANDTKSEEMDVLVWRLREFRALGFSELEASALSHSDADLGRARSLRKAHCPPDVALRILL